MNNLIVFKSICGGIFLYFLSLLLSWLNVFGLSNELVYGGVAFIFIAGFGLMLTISITLSIKKTIIAFSVMAITWNFTFIIFASAGITRWLESKMNIISSDSSGVMLLMFSIAMLGFASLIVVAKFLYSIFQHLRHNM